MLTALVNARVLGDAGFIDAAVVLIDGARIVDVVVASDPRIRAAQIHDLRGLTLAPGFIDCQVNGGGGVLFNDAPTVDGIRRIAQAHRKFGTTGLLPTLISDDAATLRAAIAATRAAIRQRVPGVLGIHLEGPFLAPQRKGIHDAAKFRAPTAKDVDLIAVTDAGRVLVTLAPERVAPQTIRALVERGVILSAGHTAATWAQTRVALDSGVRGFTHLFNAMSPLQSREPGVVGAALEDCTSWCGIIVDGHHVHPAALRVALAAKPRGKVFLVTDAMPPVGSDDAQFTLNGETITCLDGNARMPTACSPAPRSTWPAPCAMPSPCSACPRTKHCAWRQPIRLLFSDWKTPMAASRRAMPPTSSRWMRISACAAPGSVACARHELQDSRWWAVVGSNHRPID